MWKPEHRLAADRSGLRYPSDLTDAEWAIVAPMIPPARHGGRKRSVNVREVVNGIFYVLWTGCQWKALPKRPAAEEHGARLSRALELGRHIGAYPPCALRCGSANRRDVKQVRRSRSSTRRPRRVLKKGVLA